ncbi:MAG: branched-chain amino acid ABC transporter permease [Spirochaetaceae bacterium]|nr:MAG: branched-chain amino acid ABC transporter permease [Spirochaetaceae bacterium]
MYFLQQILNGLSLGAVYSLIAVGFALVFNILKFSNFSQGGLITVCAYIGFMITRTFGLGLGATLALTALAGGVIALLVERVAFRRLRRKNSPLIYYFVSSITMGILLENLITIYFSSNFYAFPRFFARSTVRFGPFFMATTDLAMLGISLSSLLILMIVLYRTTFGTAIRALSMDMNAARLMGINVNFAIAGTFFLVGVFAGLGGVFLGINYTLYPQLGKLIVKGFVASVVGGLGNILGAVVGAILLGLLEVILVGVPGIGSGLSPVVVFVILLVFLIVRPQGIAGIIVKEKV